MPKLGLITDGVSRELEHALTVMNAFGLAQAELQFLWDKEVGDLDDKQLDKTQSLLTAHKVEVSCVSRHIFAGLPVDHLETHSPAYQTQLAALRRCVDMAQALDCPLVRVMSFRKEMILFGSHGAEEWVVTVGAWDKLRALFAPALQIAEDRGVTLVVETGNNAMINSAFLARRLIDAMDSPRLKVLWDPANSLYCAEPPFPDGLQALGDSLAHIHLKDAAVDIAKATVDSRPLGGGDMAPYLPRIASALKTNGYDGAISLESVYRPLDGSFEDGFRASVSPFLRLFA